MFCSGFQCGAGNAGIGSTFGGGRKRSRKTSCDLNHTVGHILAAMLPKEFPELIILRDANDMPNGALCSVCGEPISVEYIGFFSLLNLEAYAAAFKRHLESDHPEVLQDESSATQ